MDKDAFNMISARRLFFSYFDSFAILADFIEIDHNRVKADKWSVLTPDEKWFRKNENGTERELRKKSEEQEQNL